MVGFYWWLYSIRRNFPLSFSITDSFRLYRTHSRWLCIPVASNLTDNLLVLHFFSILTTILCCVRVFLFALLFVFDLFLLRLSANKVCAICVCVCVWLYLPRLRSTERERDREREGVCVWYRFDCLGLVLCCTHIGMRWAVFRCHDVATVKANPNISKACFNIHLKWIGKGDALYERKLWMRHSYPQLGYSNWSERM